MSFTNNSDINSSSIVIESDFNMFNSEMEGGKLKALLESSEIMVDTSSVDVNSSEINLSDSDMVGGRISRLNMDSSEIMVDTSSVDVNSSEINLSDSDMVGGKILD